MKGFQINTTAGEAQILVQIRYPNHSKLDPDEMAKKMVEITAETLMEVERRTA